METTTPGALVLLTRLSRLTHRRTTEEILGMRMKQFGILCYLRDRGPVHQQELGDILYMDPNNLVLLLNDVETPGWIERRRDPEDRRRHIVALTDAGEAAIVRGELRMESIEDEILGGLSGKEREMLRQLLVKALERSPTPIGGLTQPIGTRASRAQSGGVVPAKS